VDCIKEDLVPFSPQVSKGSAGEQPKSNQQQEV